MPAACGSSDTQLALPQIDVEPFEPNQFSAPETCFSAEQDDQARLLIQPGTLIQSLELIEVTVSERRACRGMVTRTFTVSATPFVETARQPTRSLTVPRAVRRR